MSSRGETREQPSIPDSSPAPLCIEHVSLAVAVVALTIALGALVVEAATHMELLRGAYSILAALIVCGFVGFVGKLVLRELAALRAGQLEVRTALRNHEDPWAPEAEAEAALQRIGIKLLHGGRADAN